MTCRRVFYLPAIVDGKLTTIRLPEEAITTRENMPKPKDPRPEDEVACVCAECGHEQIGMDPCRKCGSLRTVLLSVVVREFGENWRETCFPTSDAP